MTATERDPYPQIKHVIEQELEEATRLQGEVFAGKPDAIEKVNGALDSVCDQLGALEQAVSNMMLQPSRYGLDQVAAHHRQIEVEGLRFQMSDLQRMCDQVKVRVSSSGGSGNSGGYGGWKSAAPGGAAGNGLELSAMAGRSSVKSSGHHTSNGYHPTHTRQQPPSGASAGPTTLTALPVSTRWDPAFVDPFVSHQHEAIQQTIRRQDDDLEEISIHVGNVRDVGLAMHEEIEEQERLLGGLEEDVDTQQLQLKGLRRKVQDVLKKTSSWQQFMIIVCLSVVLTVLTFFALA